MTIRPDHENLQHKVELHDMPPAPTDETVVVPPPEHRDDKHNLPWYRKRTVQIGGAAAALVAAGAAVFALNGGPSEKTRPKNEPVASAPANPGDASPSAEVSATPEKAAKITFTPIDATELKHPKQLAKTLGDVFTQADMAGADPEWASGFDIENESFDDYAIKRVNSYMPDYVDTYYAKSDDPATAESLSQAELSAKQTLAVYLGSLVDDPQNTAPYERIYTVTDLKITPRSENEGVLQFTVTTEDNRLSNVGQNMLKGSDQIIGFFPNKTGYVVIDGKLLFTHYDITP